MNKSEYLLQQLSEECLEVSHRISKALRFGLLEAQPGEPINLDRIRDELTDLVAVAELYEEQTGTKLLCATEEDKAKKKRKVGQYMAYSQEQGCLHEHDPEEMMLVLSGVQESLELCEQNLPKMAWSAVQGYFFRTAGHVRKLVKGDAGVEQS